MKHLSFLFAFFLCFSFFQADGYGQIKPLKKLKEKANEKIAKEIDNSLDKAFDKKDKDKESKEVVQDSKNSQVQPLNQGIETSDNTNSNQAESESIPELQWSKYDFVPGDEIIFEDNQSGEENGEFPSRWDLKQGTVENAVFGGENVIMFRGGSPSIVPYLKNSKIDYLPDVFTIEFDLYLPYNSFTVNFYDNKNQSPPSGHHYLSIWSESMDLNPAKSNLPDGGTINKRWAHISIAHTNGKMKAYIDETRLINIPHLSFNPSGITLHAYHANDNNRFYMKNFRLAEGGVKYYDKFLQDGKIVSNGIRFDVGKATLRPESMGVLNEIYLVLSQHQEVKFSIEGHTDSDGDFDLNQKLSEERAKTVMNQLVMMGIEKNRLSFKGYGESIPTNTNDTAEGRASNRRVEFVKSN